MIETGGAVLPEHYDAVNASRLAPCPISLEIARGWLVDNVPHGAACHWLDWQGAPVELRAYATDLIASNVIGSVPVSGLAMNTMTLGWHQDRLAPPGTWNATTVFRDRCTGGMLVLAEQRQAWRMLDGECLIFDNQKWHGLTDVLCEPGGYRISLILHVPKVAK